MPLDDALRAALAAPFPAEQIELKPGATSRKPDKVTALALAYVDPRVYQDRLDFATSGDWSVEYRPLGTNAIICRLTICGVAREDVGEADPKDPNAATVAVAQAFKRACASFGLGRYLYSLEQYWGLYDEQSKKFKEPARIVSHLYKQAGLK
jgi:hypothetical protein